MVYDPNMYLHDMDRKAFAVLDRFPAFLKLTKMYSANFDDKAAKIDLLSTSLKLSNAQRPDIYTLLSPVCEKLKIEEPDLYIIHSKEINAFTGGIEEPYICITSRMAEELPTKMLSSVIAHECGHIACKHNMYHMLANIAATKADSLFQMIPGIGDYLTPTLIRALTFWDRCSELSADRAALLCDDDYTITVDTLLRIHGFDSTVNRDEFIKQSFELKGFVNESTANRIIETMMMSDEDHPRLATRVYECVDWARSEQYSRIINGTYIVGDFDDSNAITENSVIDAEISINTDQGSFTVSENDVDTALADLNKELDRYTNKADKADYAAAVASGLISGILDALYVGEFSIKGDSLGLAHKQVNKFIQEYAKERGYDHDRLKDAIIDLEDNFKVAQDNVWKGAGIGVSAKNHHLADLAHHPTPLGLMSAIVVRFLRVGTFVNKNGEWHFVPVATDLKDLASVLAPAVLTGFLNWILNVAERIDDDDTETIWMPDAIRKIARIVACSPMIIEMIKCADNWFGHLVSDMGGSRSTAGGGMGIPGVFISFLYETASLPGFKDTEFPKIVNDLYEKQKVDMRHEVGAVIETGKQAVPVVVNELFVRAVYLLNRLGLELDKGHGLMGVDWNNVIPFGNRTIDRMITVASMTFTVADTADAAVHAAIESGGNWVLFSGKFVTRFNYIGAGRAALAVVKELSNEQKEEQLIHQKLLLTEIKTEIVLKKLQEYEEQLEQRLYEYLAEDIESFIEGFNIIEEGIETGDSNKVIHGNVVIQKVLGREPQFADQQEFDELMDSDVPLQL